MVYSFAFYICVMRHDAVADEIVGAFYFYVINMLKAAGLNGYDFVEENVGSWIADNGTR